MNLGLMEELRDRIREFLLRDGLDNDSESKKADFGLYVRDARIVEVANLKPEQPQAELLCETEFWLGFNNCETAMTERQKVVSALLNGVVWLHVSASDKMATGGMGMGKTGIRSYVCSPVKQHSECNKNYSQSPPISGNRKVEHLWRGNQDEDEDPDPDPDPNGGMTVITIRDEGEKSDTNYNSSLASSQFLTLAISSLLLCLMVLFPNFAQKHQAITAGALMGATLGSLVSLETILKWPTLARTCGYLALLSLLVALASLVTI